MKKRFLCLALVLVMLVGIIPFSAITAFAAEETDFNQGIYVNVPAMLGDTKISASDISIRTTDINGDTINDAASYIEVYGDAVWKKGDYLTGDVMGDSETYQLGEEYYVTFGIKVKDTENYKFHTDVVTQKKVYIQNGSNVMEIAFDGDYDHIKLTVKIVPEIKKVQLELSKLTADGAMTVGDIKIADALADSDYSVTVDEKWFKDLDYTPTGTPNVKKTDLIEVDSTYATNVVLSSAGYIGPNTEIIIDCDTYVVIGKKATKADGSSCIMDFTVTMFPQEVVNEVVLDFEKNVGTKISDFDYGIPADANYEISSVSWYRTVNGFNDSKITDTSYTVKDYENYYVALILVPKEGYRFSINSNLVKWEGDPNAKMSVNTHLSDVLNIGVNFDGVRDRLNFVLDGYEIGKQASDLIIEKPLGVVSIENAKIKYAGNVLNGAFESGMSYVLEFDFRTSTSVNIDDLYADDCLIGFRRASSLTKIGENLMRVTFDLPILNTIVFALEGYSEGNSKSDLALTNPFIVNSSTFVIKKGASELSGNLEKNTEYQLVISAIFNDDSFLTSATKDSFMLGDYVASSYVQTGNQTAEITFDLPVLDGCINFSITNYEVGKSAYWVDVIKPFGVSDAIVSVKLGGSNYDGNIMAGKNYTVQISFMCDDVIPDSVTKDTVKLDGVSATSVTRVNAKTMTATFDLPALSAEIDGLDIIIAQPKAGETPATSATEKNEKVKIVVLGWTKDSTAFTSAFVHHEEYTVTFLIVPNDGYSFSIFTTQEEVEEFKKNCSVNGFEITSISYPTSGFEVQNITITATLMAHTYGNYANDNPDRHYKACTDPDCPQYVDSIIDWGEHEFGEGVCTTTSATCSVCNGTFDVNFPHSFGEWQIEIPATCKSSGTVAHKQCTVCGECYDEDDYFISDITIPVNASNHESSKYNYTANNNGTHTKTHACCDAVANSAEVCFGTTATCTEKSVCTFCEATYGDFAAHSHGSAWKSDTEDHWKECACGDKKDIASHTDGNSDNKCDVCNYDIPVVTPTFDVWVGGVGMSDGDYLANGASSTTTTAPAEGGYAHYSAGVLTLNNYSYSGAGYMYDTANGYYAIIYSSVDIQVVLVGKNAVTQSQSYSSAIECKSDITISGEGSLDMEAEYAIEAFSGKLTVNNGVISVLDSNYAFWCDYIVINGGKISINSYYDSIYADEDIDINGGTLYLRSEFGTIGVLKGAITINGGYIDAASVGGLSTECTFTSAPSIDSSLKAMASTTALGSLGEYVAANVDTYNRVVIGATISTYTVSFNANGADGTMTTLSGVLGAYELPVNEFTAPTGMNFKGWATTPDGSVISGSSINVNENIVLYAIWEKAFDVWVGGVGMSDGDYLANGASSTTTVAPAEGGYAYYSAGVLTLSNYSYSGAGYMYDTANGYYAVIYSSVDIKIVLVGDNTLTQTSVDSEAICCEYNLIIDGTGKLTTKGDYGITAYDTLTINNGTFDLDAYYAICSDTITVNGGTIKINATTNAIYGVGDVTINGGTLNIISEGDGIASDTKVSIFGGYIDVQSTDIISDNLSCAIRGADIVIDSGLVVQASTEHDGVLGAYDAAEFETYDRIVIYVPHTCSGGIKQNGQSATCTVDGWNDYYKCSGCNKYYTDAACTPANEITDLAAWKTGAGKITAGHTPNADDGDCTTAITCSVCGTETTAASTHVDADTNGKCDTCSKDMPTTPGGDEPGTDVPGGDEPGTDEPGTDDPNAGNTEDPTDDNDGLSGGAIAGIVIGSTVVAGTGGFSLFWFVIKKKSWAELLAVFKKG